MCNRVSFREEGGGPRVKLFLSNLVSLQLPPGCRAHSDNANHQEEQCLPNQTSAPQPHSVYFQSLCALK